MQGKTGQFALIFDRVCDNMSKNLQKWQKKTMARRSLSILSNFAHLYCQIQGTVLKID
jgi:hypothetical protein